MNLNGYNRNKPYFHLRYVDDTLAAFEKEQVSLNILKLLNSMCTNIKFAIEK